ncbi:hypothetical protein NEFER03_1439 [Nematocida sp. LUAm3]|nr:hypothetical protein NEFER03_1439 [Nematocida sp. LUAm3]KAI5174731.1 hypothetical protein NEFER02_0841 [Nematocida sp. LUAm2]KAI5177858.1 hypothetical protein NEFER01_1060 [Nematocida sp. LUAm1]
MDLFSGGRIWREANEIAHKRRTYMLDKHLLLQFYMAITSIWNIGYLFGVLYSHNELWTYERGLYGCIWKYFLITMIVLYFLLGLIMWFGKLIISYEHARKGHNISNQVSSIMILCMYSIKNIPLLLFYYWGGALSLFFFISISFARYIICPMLFIGASIKIWNSGKLFRGVLYGKGRSVKKGYALLFVKSLVSLSLYISGLSMCIQDRKWKFDLEFEGK